MLRSGLLFALRLTFFPQSHITFELYERNHGRGKSVKEYSIKLSLSEGAHSSNVLDSALDARHSLNVQPRKCVFSLPDDILLVEMLTLWYGCRKLTQHLPYSLVIEKLSKHFGRVMEVRSSGSYLYSLSD